MINLKVNPSYTLFLDRDGVINKKIDNDYVKDWDTFAFNKGTLNALKKLSGRFLKIIIVTNQQGIGKGLMSEDDLTIIHKKMLKAINEAGGKIDEIYFAPQLASENSTFRKPQIGMAMQAKLDFPEIDLEKAIIVGDSPTDMEFGRKLGMICVGIGSVSLDSDFSYQSLAAFAEDFLENRMK